MPWRYNLMKRELQFFDPAVNRIVCFEASFLAALAGAGMWRNCEYENLRKLPISTK